MALPLIRHMNNMSASYPNIRLPKLLRKEEAYQGSGFSYLYNLVDHLADLNTRGQNLIRILGLARGSSAAP